MVTTSMVHHLILASSSKRRIELLKRFVKYLIVIPPRYDEVLLNDPIETIYANSRGKTYSVYDDAPGDSVIIGVDTIIHHPRYGVVGKPVDLEDARRILKLLSGNIHSVYTGVFLVDKPRKKEYFFHVVTYVKFYELSEEEIDIYLSTGEPLGKAGGYAIQENAMLFVEWIMGDFYNVIGLPIARLYRVLKSVYGIDLFRGK